MSCPIPSDQLDQLKVFIQVCRKSPDLLNAPQLSFFREFIESFGGKIPTASASASPPPRSSQQQQTHQQPPPQPQHSEEPMEEDEIVESEVDLDMDGITPAHPDDDKPQVMGSNSDELDDDAMEQSNEQKRIAVEHYMSENYDEAANAYTKAILLNPRSAMLYAKRGQSLLMQNKYKSCIRDCDQAIELNQDCAAAYKFRGRARFLLAEFLQAAEDLRFACRLDFDEQADAWLKMATPNARKLEEHRRKYERLRLERKIRLSKKRQAASTTPAPAPAAAAAPPPPPSSASMPQNGDFAMPANPMDFLRELMQDPTVSAGMQDPEVVAAVSDITSNPMNFMKYMDNPKLAAVIEKVKNHLKSPKADAPAEKRDIPIPENLDVD